MFFFFNFLKQFIQNRRYYKKLLGFDGEFPHGECFQPPCFFECLEAGFVRGQSFANIASLLGPQVQGNVLLALVKLSQIFLLFLVGCNKCLYLPFSDITI